MEKRPNQGEDEAMPNLCPIDSQNHEPCAEWRGPDLSGSLQGAGGIGGLLARTDMGQWIAGSSFATAFYHSDANGNVTCLMYPNGLLAAKYLYDPFGNMLAQSGSLASANRYRFSSKEWDSNSGLYYYLYRFYDPNFQRWLNRDPIGEWGGWNLYRFVRNTPTRAIDAFGLHLWQGLPIINLSICFSSEPGGNPADYASIPSPSCKDCQSDPEGAEAKCDEAVNAMESSYLGNAGYPMLLDGVGDGLLTLGGLIYPPVWLGLIPNGIATACEIKNLMNISSEASNYKNTYCKCHSKGN